MKKNNRTIITTIITASLLLISTGCSQSAEVVNITPDITTDSTAVTTINAEAEKPKTTTAVTTAAQTTAHTTTAAETTAITTVPVTEAPPATKQTEAPAPVKTTATTKTAPVVTTTTTTAAPTPKPEEKTDEDRSYLNLTPSEVQGILDECTKYAKSLGFKVMSYAEYEKALEEMQNKTAQLSADGAPWEEIQAVLDDFNAELKYIKNYDCEQFWSTGWHNIAFAGDYDLVKGGDMDGYWLCKTKQESIDWLKGYLKFYIKLDYDEGRSSGAIATPLKTFDQMAKEDKCIFPYDVLHSYYADYMVYDINTSYAFCVKFN